MNKLIQAFICFVFFSCFASTASFAGLSCLHSTYQPQVVIISKCPQRVCFATITCGEGKDDNKPAPWKLNDLKTSTIVYSTVACPAAADGTCSSDVLKCRELAKKSNYFVGEMGVSSGLPSIPTPDGNSALQFQSLSVVKIAKSGVCSTPVCVGSVKQYDYKEIVDAATSDKNVKNDLLSSIQPIAEGPIGCLGNDSEDPQQMSCPGVNKCAADELAVIVDPGSTESKTPPANNILKDNSKETQVILK